MNNQRKIPRGWAWVNEMFKLMLKPFLLIRIRELIEAISTSPLYTSGEARVTGTPIHFVDSKVFGIYRDAGSEEMREDLTGLSNDSEYSRSINLINEARSVLNKQFRAYGLSITSIELEGIRTRFEGESEDSDSGKQVIVKIEPTYEAYGAVEGTFTGIISNRPVIMPDFPPSLERVELTLLWEREPRWGRMQVLPLCRVNFSFADEDELHEVLNTWPETTRDQVFAAVDELDTFSHTIEREIDGATGCSFKIGKRKTTKDTDLSEEDTTTSYSLEICVKG